MSPYIKLS